MSDEKVVVVKERREKERRHGIIYRLLSPTVIAAIFTGLALLIAAVCTGIVTIMAEQREQKKLTKEFRDEQSRKVNKVIGLVDGAKTTLLKKIAIILRQTATRTKDPEDIKAAEQAEREAAEQEAALKLAETKEEIETDKNERDNQ